MNLLSFLDSGNAVNSGNDLKIDHDDIVGKLKERLSQFMAYDCKSDSSRFLEYWVPIPLSNVQLEQYCGTLLSNTISLCSCSKNDPVGALRDVLISTRKVRSNGRFFQLIFNQTFFYYTHVPIVSVKS